MNDLEPSQKGPDRQSVTMHHGNMTSLEVYDKYGAMAYGIILQILPQAHLAQEVLVSVFSSPQLQACNSYPFSYVACIIKLARAQAVEAKRKLMTIAPSSDHEIKRDISPEQIFELSFRQGFTPEEVAEKLNISKSEVLRSFHEYFKIYRNA
jgi:hypothetical protein